MSERAQSPFRSRNFRIYWTGGLISNVGTWLQNVSGSVFILEHTHSTLLVGLLNVATFAPMFLFSILGGMISDRYDRRAVVVVTQVVSAIAATVITVLSATGRLSAATLIGLAFVLGSSYAVTKPAQTAMLPAVVPEGDIAHATAINTLQFNIGQIGGAALSAAILAVSSTTWAFGINAVSFAGPAISALLLDLQRQERTTAIRGSGMEGLRFALGNRAILAILAAVVLSNASMEALRTLAPSITSHTLGGDADSAGLIVTGYSIGGTIGILSFGYLTRHFRSQRVLVAAFLLQSAGLAGLAFSRTILLGVICTVPVGLGFSLNIPILSGGLLRLSPDAFRGRVMSFFSMSMFGMRPLFSLIAGAIGTFVAPSVVLLTFLVFPIVALRLVGATGRAIAASRSAAATNPVRPQPNATG